MAWLKTLFLFASATATSFARSRDDGEQQKAMILGDTCRHPNYKTHILSKSPLVIYLSDFLTAEERAHLTEIT
jgi:prolyl 4-hydroxylase